MRKVIFAINVSLDGCCDHTKFNPDVETYDYFTNLVRSADTFVYGRKTYQLMVPYWPDVAKNRSGDKAENDYADAFDAVKKIIVFSKSLDNAAEDKTEIFRTGLQDTILKLKQEEGKNILTGGPNIASQLIALGLIDEYHLMVHPIVVGGGTRLFEGISPLPLKLLETRTLKSGCMLLRYANR